MNHLTGKLSITWRREAINNHVRTFYVASFIDDESGLDASCQEECESLTEAIYKAVGPVFYTIREMRSASD